MKNEIVKVEPIKNKKATIAKVFAIVAFSLTMAALASAIASDVIVFATQIILFIAACFGGAIAFIIGLVLFMISFILVFGFYIMDAYGFWPATWAVETFNSILADAKLAPEQIQILIIVRIVLVATCVIALGLSIASLVLLKSIKKNGITKKQKLSKAFSIVALIFSILGVLMAGAVIALLSFI